MTELRDLDVAKKYIVEGLCLQRAVRPTSATIRPALEWAMEIVSGGHPLPPMGFVADVGHIAFGADNELRSKEMLAAPGWPPSLARTYEDHVLGKLYSDWMFERATDALRKFNGKDRTKGLSYVLNQIRDRAGIGGVTLPPAVIRSLLSTNPEDILSTGLDSLMTYGISELQIHQYEELAAIGRRMTDFLVKEDVDALEDRSALGDMGQYIALRQIRQTTSRIESDPIRLVKPKVGRKEVPTRILDEDQYPVGGYTSISTRGSIESLLHSQLAFMEKESPDLFDLKFVRDELFYYSRDENQFLRRRRGFVFVFFQDLINARFKDPELPHQRIVMLQSAIMSLIHRISDWLNTDALRFDVLFVQDGEKKDLSEETTLMQILLREPIKRGDVSVNLIPDQIALIARLDQLARQMQVHCLLACTDEKMGKFELENVEITKIVIDSSIPKLFYGGKPIEIDGNDAFEIWQGAVMRILELWV
jgi:hypothetical protein